MATSTWAKVSGGIGRVAAEPVDAVDDELPQRLDDLGSLGGHPVPRLGVAEQIEGELVPKAACSAPRSTAQLAPPLGNLVEFAAPRPGRAVDITSAKLSK